MVVFGFGMIANKNETNLKRQDSSAGSTQQVVTGSRPDCVERSAAEHALVQAISHYGSASVRV